MSKINRLRLEPRARPRHIAPMCNALSPEKAVMWTFLYEGGVDPLLCAEHFTYESYRRWFAVLAASGDGRSALNESAFCERAEAMGHALDHRERRALKRMLRVPPPPRVRANRELLIQALADRFAGKRMHIERLIN